MLLHKTAKVYSGGFRMNQLLP